MNTIAADERTPLGLGWADVIFGGWLIVSPFVLGAAHNAACVANNICVGLAIILLMLASVKRGLLKALVAILGPWLFASAFILGGPKAFMWNNLIFAFLVVVADIASESPVPRRIS